ncbi:MAG: matrixin family metalloprotease [Halobacteriovoraceae bacterium]|nr:matrixin family metalloprotease [Halobacteriovoraceae bacterium]
MKNTAKNIILIAIITLTVACGKTQTVVSTMNTNQGDIRWENLGQTIYVTEDFSDDEFAALQNAAQVWNDTLGTNAIDIVRGGVNNQYTNLELPVHDRVSEATKQYTWDQSQKTTVALCWYTSLGGFIKGADLHFNYHNYKFSTGEETARFTMDLETIAIHEMGHFLGLAHSDHAEDVMYPYSFYGQQKRELSKNDQERIIELYR